MTDQPQASNSPLGNQFEPILREFGLNSASIIVLIPIILNTLGLKDNKWFDVGAWTVTTLMAFAVVLVARRAIRLTPLSALGWVLLAYILLGALLLAVKVWLPTEWRSIPPIWKAVYCAFVISCGAAVVIAAYRYQEKGYGGSYPVGVRQALEELAYKQPFVRLDMTYQIKVDKIDKGSVYFETTLSYSVENRSNNREPYTITFDMDIQRARITATTIDGASSQLSASRRPGDLIKTIHIDPGKKSTISITAYERFPHEGSELYSSYQPAEGLTVKILDAASSLEFTHEQLGPAMFNTKPGTATEPRSIATSGGLLPNQGLRLFWEPTKDTRDQLRKLQEMETSDANRTTYAG